MKFRKDFEQSSTEKQRSILNGLRQVLRVSKGAQYLSDQADNSHLQFGNVGNVISNFTPNTQGNTPGTSSQGVTPPFVSRSLDAFQTAFGNKQMRSDIDSYLEVCYVPIWVRRRRMLLGVLVTSIFHALCGVLTGVSLWLAWELEREVEDKDEQQRNLLLSYTVSGVFSGLLIPILNYCHRQVALSFTDWEAYRTIRDYQASVFYKLFFFEFINYFNGLFLVAFQYQNMTQLRVQVASIMVTMCVVGNFKELIMPMILQDVKRVNEVSARGGTDLQGGALGRSLRQVDDQWDRADDFLLVDEVIELVLQFGMVTMFAVAFPGLPMVWLLSTLLELRVDAYKFIRLLKTPEPCFSLGIGVAYYAFQSVAVLSLFVNSALLMFTKYTDERGKVLEGTGVEVLFPDQSFREHASFVVALEHILFAVVYIMLRMIPTMSSSIREDAWRQLYYEKREDTEYRRDEDDSVSTKSLQAQSRRRRRTLARKSVARTPSPSPRASPRMSENGAHGAAKLAPCTGASGEPRFFPVTTDAVGTHATVVQIRVDAGTAESDARAGEHVHLVAAAQSAESALLLARDAQTAESSPELVMEAPARGE